MYTLSDYALVPNQNFNLSLFLATPLHLVAYHLEVQGVYQNGSLLLFSAEK